MTVKKWTPGQLGGMKEADYGEWVSEEDYDALAARLADSERLREDERLTWDAQHKRQASMNAHLAALVTDAQEELRKCQQDAIQLQARLAEAQEQAKADRLVVDEAYRNEKAAKAWLAEADDYLASLQNRYEQVTAENVALSERLQEAEALLREAREKVGYMASGMTHASWVTIDAQKTLARIAAFLARDGASVEGEK